MDANIVLVFDFDKTMIDFDSDEWVVDEMGLIQLFNQLHPTMPFNTLMDRMMMELHLQGKTIEDIENCLKHVALNPWIVQAIKSAHALGCDLRIVSDANVFFIETILGHHGLMHYFSEINTNPSVIDKEGRLRILPYHDLETSSCCSNSCPPNMCKGVIIERIRESVSAEGRKRFIYLGDGKGDFCPSLKLEEGDHVMPKKDYPLCELICNDPLLMKAKVHRWSNGQELEKVLLRLIKTIIAEETKNIDLSQVHSSNWEFSTNPVYPMKHFPVSL